MIISAIQLSQIHIAGILNQCYSQPNCTEGSEIETPTKNPTPSDCCSRTNDGQSYADSGGNCVIPQCVGMMSDHKILA